MKGNVAQDGTEAERASFSPLAYFLQCVPAESRPVLENVIESMQGTQLPPLLLVVDGWRCQSSLRRQRRSERGRGRGQVLLLLLRVCEVPGPFFLCSHHHLPSSSSSSRFLLTDLPAHAAQLLQSPPTFARPLPGWIWRTSHPAVTAATFSSSANFRTRYISIMTTISIATSQPPGREELVRLCVEGEVNKARGGLTPARSNAESREEKGQQDGGG